MFKKIYNLYITLFNKYREQLLYLIFGVLTTVVNLITYRVCTYIIPAKQQIFGIVEWFFIATSIAWIVAVLFAFFTNRSFVFQSKAKGLSRRLYEFFSFIACRLFTLGVEFAMMFVMVNLLFIDDFFSKAMANIVVIVLNYVGSKLIIFRGNKS